MTTKAIHIKDCGAITQLSIPLPEEGGVVVLRGNQGVGKSTALQAVSALAGGSKSRLSVRDEKKRGEIVLDMEPDTIRMTLTKSRQSVSGDTGLECLEIEARVDLGKIIDPGIQDEERADAARIKQLIALAGAKADASAYEELIGEEPIWQEFDWDDNTDDPLELHRRFCQACQALARTLEKQAAERRVDMIPLMRRYGSVQTKITAAECKQVLDTVTRENIAVEERVKAAEQAAKRREAAEAQLREATAGDMPNIEEAEEQAKDAFAEHERAKEVLYATEKILAEARARLDKARVVWATIEGAKAAIAASAIAPPSEEERRQSAEAVEKAAAALQAAILAEEGKRLINEANGANAAADMDEAMAATIRAKAKEAEQVLATLIPEGEIRISGTRLVVSTDRSAEELYAELSHGERAIAAVLTAARHLPTGGLCTISQEVWGGIAPENKAKINQLVKELGVTLITAEATDDMELTAHTM